MDVFSLVQILGQMIDLYGVIVIVFGVSVSTIAFVLEWLKETEIKKAYRLYRENLGRVILLGLEILVAGDIIRSVAGTPSFTSVGILALIVLVRSFLSITFEMEVDGKWPWNRSKKSSEI